MTRLEFEALPVGRGDAFLLQQRGQCWLTAGRGTAD
jgi:hypothetical protein